jgi:hypothetical protein
MMGVTRLPITHWIINKPTLGRHLACSASLIGRSLEQVGSYMQGTHCSRSLPLNHQ